MSAPAPDPPATARAREAPAPAAGGAARLAARAPQPRLPDAPVPTLAMPAQGNANGSEDPPAAGGDTGGDTGDDIVVTRALARDALARDMARKLPALELSAQDLERLSDAVMQVRAHQIRLRRLAHTRENAAAREHTQTLLMAELKTFQEVTGMSAVDLTDALSDEGLTTEEQDDAEPVYELLPAPEE